MERKQEIILTIGSHKHAKLLAEKQIGNKIKFIHIDERDPDNPGHSKHVNVLYTECVSSITKNFSVKAVVAFGRASVIDSVRAIAECCEMLKETCTSYTKFICPSIRGAEIFNDKFKTYRALEKEGAKLPKTIKVTSQNVGQIKIKYPAVLKAVNLTGGCGMVYVKSKKHLLEEHKKLMDRGIKNLIVVDFLSGVEASYSVLRLGDKFIRLPVSYRQSTSETLIHPDAKVKITGLLKGDDKIYQMIEKLMFKYNVQGLMYLEGVIDKGKTFKYLEGGTRISGSMPVRSSSLVGFDFYQTLFDYIEDRHFSLTYPQRVCVQYSSCVHHGQKDVNRLNSFTWVVEAKHEDLSQLPFSNSEQTRIRISFVFGDKVEAEHRLKLIQSITGNKQYKSEVLRFMEELPANYQLLIPATKNILKGKWNSNLSWEFCLSDTLPDKKLTTAVFAIPVYKNESIALTKTQRGWELPGGHVEEGEDIEEALCREVKEEIGVELINYRFIGFRRIISMSPEPNRKGGHYPHPVSYILHYVGEIKEKPTSPIGMEVLEAKLFSRKKLIRTKFSSSKIIKLLIAKKII